MGILQARILEWVAVSFSRGSSQPRGQTQVSHIADGFFTACATRKAHGKCFHYSVPMGASDSNAFKQEEISIGSYN